MAAAVPTTRTCQSIGQPMRALLLCVLCLIAVLHKTTAFHPILYSPTASPVMGAKTRVSLGMDTVRLQMLSPATHRSALQPNDGRQNCCGAIALSRDSRLYNTASSSVPQKVDAAERVPFPVMVLKFLRSNWLVLGEVLAIYLAKRNPSFGATGGPLRPELFISQLGVMFIFFVNGIQLNLSAGGSPSEIALSTKTNLLIQLYNFGLIPIMFKLLAPYYPDPAFRDGLLVLSCIPCTINICVAQTLAAGGNMGTAIFNAIFANVVGVFLTPLLAIWMLGAGKGVSLLKTLNKLGFVVIAPLVAGQLARRTPLGALAQRVSRYSRTMSSCLLLAIVYNVFSDTFMKGIGVASSSLLNLIVAMPVAYLSLSGIFWIISGKLLPGLDPPTRTAALLCSSQKTLAFGIPFIKTAFGTRADIAYLLAPLLMYGPTQLLLGSSIMVPALRKWIQKSQNFEDGGGI